MFVQRVSSNDNADPTALMLQGQPPAAASSAVVAASPGGGTGSSPTCSTTVAVEPLQTGKEVQQAIAARDAQIARLHADLRAANAAKVKEEEEMERLRTQLTGEMAGLQRARVWPRG